MPTEAGYTSGTVKGNAPFRQFGYTGHHAALELRHTPPHIDVADTEALRDPRKFHRQDYAGRVVCEGSVVGGEPVVNHLMRAQHQLNRSQLFAGAECKEPSRKRFVPLANQPF